MSGDSAGPKIATHARAGEEGLRTLVLGPAPFNGSVGNSLRHSRSTAADDVQRNIGHHLGPMSITISPATDEEVRSGFVGRQLREFNYRFAGEYPEQQSIRLNARDAAGEVVGGLRAVVALYWLRLEVLWVRDDMRGKGIGSRLLAEAESTARELGAKNAALETFEWQAPAFYAKHGYEEVARMEKYFGDYYLAIMRMALR